MEGNASVKIIPSLTPHEALKSKKQFEKSPCVCAELGKNETHSGHIKQ